MRACPIGAIVMRDEINEIVAQLKLHAKDYRERARFNKPKRGWYKVQISKSKALIKKFERLKKTYDHKLIVLRGISATKQPIQQRKVHLGGTSI